MNLSAGIVGLPNVGKSTLFNTITNSQVEAANYPFATIEPNVGIVKVPDKRLIDLANLINPDKTTQAICKFVDIAGLVKGASKGEGLGNQFLASIREVDVICHVVRCFEDKQITHVYEGVDPVRDIEIINLELILADLESIEKRYSKVVSKAKNGNKEAMVEENACNKILEALKRNQMASTIIFTDAESQYVKNYNLLTIKKVLYIANIDETDISYPQNNRHYQKLKQNFGNDIIIPMSINMEYEISKLKEQDKVLFMQDFDIIEPALNALISTTYKILNLSTYFTFGKQEVKAWSFINGMTAPQCAGIIHSDFEKGFIRVEVIRYEDLLHYKSETLVKDNGKTRTEGKEYIMQDGDVCHFRFSPS
jgi:GTP-binding protein YchF